MIEFLTNFEKKRISIISCLLIIMTNINQTVQSKIGNQNLSYIYMLIYNIAIFSANVVISQYNHVFLHFSTIMMVRGATCMTIGYLFNQVSDFDLEVPKQDINKLILRVSSVGLVLFCRYAMFQHVSITLCQLLFNCAPLCVYIVEIIFNKLQLQKKQLFGLIAAIIGVFIVLNPDLFSRGSSLNSVSWTEKKFAILYLSCTFTWAYALIYVKVMIKKNISYQAFTTGFGFLSAGVLGFSIFDTNIAEYMQTNDFEFKWYFLLFLVGGVFGVMDQIFISAALIINNNYGDLNLINYINVLNAFLFEVFYLGKEIIIPKVIGSILILYGLIQTLKS